MDHQELCWKLQPLSYLSNDEVIIPHQAVPPLCLSPLSDWIWKESLRVCSFGGCQRECVLENHWRANPLLPVQTQCGPSASATCLQETLPREGCHIHQGDGRTVDMHLAVFGTYCIRIILVIILWDKIALQKSIQRKNQPCTQRVIQVTNHEDACLKNQNIVV